MDTLFNTVETTVERATSGGGAVRTWIFGILLAAVAAYILYKFLKPVSDEVRVDGPYTLLGAQASPVSNTTVTVFDQSQITMGLADNFTLSFYLYMDEVNMERIPIGAPSGDFRFKPLIYILGVGDILVDPVHQVARVRIKPLQQTDRGMDMTNVITVDVENFMIARWNQLTVTLEGRTVDVYLNGVLASSRLLENLPTLYPVGVLLETSPDFSGKAALVQAWPRRKTETEVLLNYKRTSDMRGKPLIADSSLSIWRDVLYTNFTKGLCDIGFCGFRFDIGPMQYIDYDFA